MSMVDQLSTFVVETTFNDIPSETVKYAKELALKTTAGMLAGSKLPGAEKIVSYIKEKGEKPDAGIIGNNLRASLENAVLVDGYFAHLSELEDDQYPGPTSDITIFPVIYPLAEKFELSGREFLEACVVGTEVMNRISYYTQPRTAQLGILLIGYYGIIGAGAVAAKALKLDKEKTKAALGLSFTQGAGSYVNLGVDAHYLDTAWACRNGFIAAEMASMGFTGGTNLEKWLTTLLGEDGVKLEKITDNIGKSPFFIHNIWTKKYPCCFLTHRHTDSLFMLIKEHRFNANDIAEIILDAGSADADICDRPEPADIESSKFSYQHILSAVLLDGDLDMDTFTDRKIDDPKFRELRSKIKVVAHPEWGAGTQAGIAKISVKLKNGTVLVKEMDQPPGGSKYPLSTAQIAELYQKYTRNILTEKQISRTTDIILNMENIDDLTELINILTFKN